MKEDTFIRWITNPLFQAGGLLIANIIITFIEKLMEWSGIVATNERFPWLSAASFLFMFAIMNSLTLLTTKEQGKYYSQSIMSFLGLAAGLAFIAYLFSSLSIWDAGSYSWIYIVLAIGYGVFFGIILMMKNVVEFAQREEWNQPRVRRKEDKKR